MNPRILVSPPAAFAVLFVLIAAFSVLSRKIAFRRKGDRPGGSGSEYACGEDFKGYTAQPDYSQFFPFAFFFTILHVVALGIATVPSVDGVVFGVAAVYCAGAVIGLSVLQRR